MEAGCTEEHPSGERGGVTHCFFMPYLPHKEQLEWMHCAELHLWICPTQVALVIVWTLHCSDATDAHCIVKPLLAFPTLI